MTAASTPRLGLISPVDSDLFTPTDYAQTFAKLDAVPGVTIVANYAGLPTTWGTNQHGSKVIQMDNFAEWVWYNPSGSGVWKRVNTVGLLSNTTVTSAVSTTLTGSSSPIFIDSGNFTAPGQRALRISLDMGLDNSTGTNSIVIINVFDNGSQIGEYNYRTGLYINGNGSTHQAILHIINPSPTSTHRITAKIRSAVTAVSGGGGTSTVRHSTLVVSEV